MTPSLGSINLPERLTELRETFTYVCQFIMKDTNEQLDEEVFRVRSRSIPSIGTSVSVEWACTPPIPAGEFIYQPRSSSSVLLFKRFFF